MSLLQGLFFRALQRGGQLVRRLGLKIGRIETAETSNAGVTLQWRRDAANTTRGMVVAAEVQGKQTWFFVADNSDLIQGYHLRGKFYEAEELAEIGKRFTGGLFVDIGANVGNHSLYALRCLGADQVIAFEPNPAVNRVLEINFRLNGFSDRTAVHRIGLSDAPGRAVVKLPFANLGGGWLEADGGGDIEIGVGDTILADQPVRFIKIDVEGMELGVLGGLRETVRRHRPTLFVEVSDKNFIGFEAWCAENGYRAERSVSGYPGMANYFAHPLA